MLRMVKDAATDTATVSTLAGGCALVGQDLLIFFSVSIRFHIFRRKQKKKKKKKKREKCGIRAGLYVWFSSYYVGANSPSKFLWRPAVSQLYPDSERCIYSTGLNLCQQSVDPMAGITANIVRSDLWNYIGSFHSQKSSVWPSPSALRPVGSQNVKDWAIKVFRLISIGKRLVMRRLAPTCRFFSGRNRLRKENSVQSYRQI